MKKLLPIILFTLLICSCTCEYFADKGQSFLIGDYVKIKLTGQKGMVISQDTTSLKNTYYVRIMDIESSHVERLINVELEIWQDNTDIKKH
ncbi:hypothetical protein KAW50_06530 [candidate division WOR-3 bacterium]|nr:hypothetical protein [candidate division WOR-3 bacterium]